MEWVSFIAPLIPVLAGIAKDAYDAAKGNDQIAIGILMGILGADEDVKTRAAMVIAKARAQEEFGS